MQPDNYEKILQKYKDKIKEEFGEQASKPAKITSQEYSQFKEELYPASYTWYEKACNFADHLLKIKMDESKAEKVQKNLNLCHLNTTPGGVLAFAILISVVIMVFGSLIAFSIPLLFGLPPMFALVIFCLLAGVVAFPALQRIPDFMANTWRMKASNQMVQSVFYLVTYMRHSSNLERAIEFAADHLDAPLSLDFRKILWDVETQQFSTIRESAEAYLEVWKEWDKDFVESFHLIESSLYEPSEDRRLSLLDKSLDVILNGTYENMLHYARDLKSPITMLHMLGIILPILGLVILPLVVSFMGSESSPFATAIYISLLYNIALPLSVYYLGRMILTKRPAGYGVTDISEQGGMKSLQLASLSIGKVTFKVNPFYFSMMIFIVAFLVGFSPLIFHSMGFADFAFDQKGNLKFLDYFCPANYPGCLETEKIGPFGLGSALLSVVFIAGVGLAFGMYYALRSKNVIKIRERMKALEDEFSSALFQLGNRLGDGLPAEIAFSKVATTMQGTTSGEFFNLVERNITKLGMGLEEAIFHPKVGALVSFPSKVIESSMKVLIESIKKGPRIAAEALLSMSRYIKEIHRVEERLKDLMADVISSMKSQVKFLTPAIAGIVIGITSMISTILTKLSTQLACFAQQGQEASTMGNMLEIFGIGLPTFHFQIIVGIYVIQLAYLLTMLSSGIENGADKLGERYELGKNMINGTLLYCALAAVVMLLFNLFANTIISNTLSCGI